MKISVVISAYNVEKFIENILQCLMRQTYENFQVIVVDDCATDNTGKLAEEYKGAFAGRGVDYEVVYKPKNEGLSMARNTGLEHAKGEYVLFWDADDVVEDDALEVIASAVKEKTPDFVVYGYTEDYYKGDTISYRVDKVPENRFYEKESLVHAFSYITELERQTMFGYAWNKAYRREFLLEHQLCYQTITHIEDVLYNLQVVTHMESMVTIPDKLYHYINRGQMRLTSKYLPEYFQLQKKRFASFIEVQEEKINWAKNTNQSISQGEMVAWEQQLNETMAAAYFRAFQSAITREIAHKTKRQEILAMARGELSGELYQKLKDHLSTEGKVVRILYAPLAQGKIQKAYCRAMLIAFVQKHFSGLYAKLKQNR